MTPNEYQTAAMRTVMRDNVQLDKIRVTLGQLPELSHILVAALKLNSESGELSDALVKHISYGQSLDVENILEECGDLLWYIALIVEKLGGNMEEVMEANIEKLKIRYPEKFTEECAKERADKFKVKPECSICGNIIGTCFCEIV